MIPKLKIYISKSLIDRILKIEIKKSELDELRNLSNDLMQFLKKKEEKMLKLYEEIIGVKWEEKDIMIYPVPIPDSPRFPSIPFPLILKMREKVQVNVYFLMHELNHRFLLANSKLKTYASLFKIQFIGIEKHEALVDMLTRKMAEKLFGKKKANELKEIEQKIIKYRDISKCEVYVKEYQQRYNLNKRTLVSYFKEELK